MFRLGCSSKGQNIVVILMVSFLSYGCSKQAQSTANVQQPQLESENQTFEESEHQKGQVVGQDSSGTENRQAQVSEDPRLVELKEKMLEGGALIKLKESGAEFTEALKVVNENFFDMYAMEKNGEYQERYEWAENLKSATANMQNSILEYHSQFESLVDDAGFTPTRRGILLSTYYNAFNKEAGNSDEIYSTYLIYSDALNNLVSILEKNHERWSFTGDGFEFEDEYEQEPFENAYNYLLELEEKTEKLSNDKS